MEKKYEERIQKFLLEQQLPDVKVKGSGPEKKNDTATPISVVDHVTQVAIETCRCSHLQEYFPHLLDLELCKANHHPRGWVVANPVHSLHVASQLEEASPPSQHWKQPPILYGEEQQRTIALNTEGIVEYWCPLDGYSAVIHDDTALEKMEHLPTVHKQKSNQLSHHAHHHSSSSHHAPTSTSKSQKSKKDTAKSSSSSAKQDKSPKKASDTKDKPPTGSQVKPSTTPMSSSVVPSTTPSSAVKTPGDAPATTPSADLQTKTNNPDGPAEITSSAATETTKTPNSPMKVDPPPVVSSSLPPATVPDKTTSATTTTTSAATTTKPASDDSTPKPPPPSLSPPSPKDAQQEAELNHLRLEEDRIRLIRRSLSSHRIEQKRKSDPKKKRKRVADLKSPGIPGWRPSDPKELSDEQEREWKDALVAAREKVDRWMENYRLCREAHWEDKKATNNKDLRSDKVRGSFYLPEDPTETTRCCAICIKKRNKVDPYWEGKNANTSSFKKMSGDGLMQCLECSFIGCSPQSINPASRQHMLQHLLISGHKFAVTCGERAQLYCFRCGDFVCHEVFEQEKERIDYTHELNYMSWKAHAIQRSFDAFSFIRTQNHGIVWRGLVATYPPLVPKEHCRAALLTSRRQAMFEGRVAETWLSRRPNAMAFSAWQNEQEESARYSIRAPVGMYNLGNTCFKSAVLQCLVHCKPVQRYFLRDTGHHNSSCLTYRRKLMGKKKRNGAVVVPMLPKSSSSDSVCLACEMDSLFLSYYGSTIGRDVAGALEEACNQSKGGDTLEEIALFDEMERGDPLVISNLLTSAWKSGGMKNLAGYEQHDAHEFLNSFLEMMGKHSQQYRQRVHAFVNTVCDNNSVLPESKTANDIAKQLFEGTLRSVLVCEECGGKRMLHEPFMNISLTLSEEVERRQTLGVGEKEISVETCLEHFILAEKLGDPVQCPSCAKKTPHKKQHTFSKLPKVLCLHLKRFDAGKNRKIDEFVSFPARGLNMGTLLSHWCEVSSLKTTSPQSTETADPKILYDLFGTVNHIGSMQSGHYVANVKVDDLWYRCNDAHVSRAGPDDGEAAVLKSDGAYILFYIRR